MGQKKPEDSGFRIIGAHTDSPGFRLKPNAPYLSNGYLMLGVEVYGGPLLASWTDRDLTLAGSLVVDDGQGGHKTVLVNLKRPVCKIPQLAIHLNRNVNDKGLKLDKQKHMPPMIALLESKGTDPKMILINALAKAAKVPAKSVVDFSLELVDTQEPTIGGLFDEFYFSGKIDNQTGCHSAVQALVQSTKIDNATRVIALFDNEEIGSNTAQGAGSTLLDTVLERVCMKGKNPRENLLRALSKSLLVSSDGSHALHPNYSDMHDKHHQPMLNKGPVIKVHASRKFATVAETKAYFANCADKAKAPYQTFSGRSDLASGSTIGPISGTRLGIPAVDVGVPMLGMHSVRETGGVMDQAYMIDILKIHFTTA